MRKYQPPREQFFRLPNNIFDLGLTPIQFVIYAYLVCCAGRMPSGWASIRRCVDASSSFPAEHDRPADEDCAGELPLVCGVP